jgi:hypothetical protein
MLKLCRISRVREESQIGWDFKKRTYSDWSLRCYYELFIR